MVNIFKTYDPDTLEETVERVYYPIIKCTDAYFKKSYEKDYHDLAVSNGVHQFCAEDNKIVLQGIRDCAVNREKHSYVIYEINKCTDDVRESVGQDIECASENEIDAWLERKKVGFRIIQSKLDFSTFDYDHVIRQNEVYSRTIPINAGKFSDVGYRMRKNDLELKDKFLKEFDATDGIFYDFNFFNQDTYDVEEN